jgi:hypothetical protein
MPGRSVGVHVCSGHFTGRIGESLGHEATLAEARKPP